MTTQTLRPDQVFSKLQQWWRFHEGFGLLYLFSNDQTGLHWLENRTREEIQHREAGSSEANTASQIHALVGLHASDPSTLFSLLSQAKPRSLFWIQPPSKDSTPWLTRLNEHRQTLIGSGALFVLCLPADTQLHASSIAPDLWSVRSMAYAVQSQHSTTHPAAARYAVHPSYTAAQEQTHLTSTNLTPNIAAWQRLYAKWEDADPQSRNRLSVSLGLQAYQDALRLHQFDTARQIAKETEQVSTAQQDDLGRATALKSLGDLDSRFGNVDSARSLYTQAIGLYEKEFTPTGLAYCWAKLAVLENPFNPAMAEKANAYAQQSGSPPVIAGIASILQKPASTI